MHVNPNILGGGYAALMIFLWVSVALDYQGRIHNTTVCLGKNRYNESGKIILRTVFLVLGVMAAFRGMDITNDTAAYYRTYQNIAYNGFAGETRMEIGYVALNILLSHIFQDNLTGFHVLLFVTASFSYFSLEQWIERHADTYGISIIAFYFLSNQSYMSAIRQSVAVGFVLWALMAWENKSRLHRHVVFFLLTFAAVLFHKTAVIAVLLPFLAKRKYTSNTTWIIIVITLIATYTNLVSSMILLIGIGTGYVTTEVGNAVNAGVMSVLYVALLLLRSFGRHRDGIDRKNIYQQESSVVSNAVYGDDFYTYCIALSLAVTVISLRAAGISRLNIYLQLIGLPYISNIMNQLKDQRIAVIVKVIFSAAIWSYSVIALVYRPEWQHIWPYHFYWQ